MKSAHVRICRNYVFLVGVFVLTRSALGWEQRDEVSHPQRMHNTAFFYRHNAAYRYASAFHYYHAKQHDVLQLTPLSEHEKIDAWFDENVRSFTVNQKARTEPTMELYGPYTAMLAWRVYRAIDWTHIHHEQTYDILSDRGITWDRKGERTAQAVDYYLRMNEVARSVAPLDITMRRAAVMMKPYFGYYRNYYPRSARFAFVAHWWHPVIYEAMMIAGNGDEQQRLVKEVDRTLLEQVLSDPPRRMLLSRELMPRYARLSPESANIFDNLHMLHGIVYDILAYEGWTEDQKRAELYRVVNAMSYQQGDERYARLFSLPHPEQDPRSYDEWMKGYEGEMNRIMEEMMHEMMPMMMPKGMDKDMEDRLWAQFRMKLSPGLEEGEIPGSLHDALMQLMPDMEMAPGSAEPGRTSAPMVDMMLKGWQKKYQNLPPVEPYPMQQEPEPSRQVRAGGES
ncbi:MAG: hypothetical protein A2X46_06030 [Lentisphaerae bacterium GWF2_57_35]|nr:MAG: hypothetical protein A2X46_06030 [Lentisphaerae bacterium GWF2_57_35]